MADQSYEGMVAALQQAEHERNELEREHRALQHQLKNAEALAAKRHVQVKTMQTLSMGIFSGLGDRDVYKLACQSIVHQLGWDSALAITYSGSRGVIMAAYQITEKQEHHLEDYLGNDQTLHEAYSQRSAVSTYTLAAGPALALRTLFHTDEVVLMPMLFGEQFYGYLVACAHSKKNETRGPEDVEFLATLAGQVAHALQNTNAVVSLEEQNSRLRKLDELKNSFISITSHQLRTPLSIIKWILSILQSDPQITLLSEQQKLIEQAYVSNERLIHVVNDLLNVSRIQEGKLPHNPQPTDLRVVLRDLLDNSERIASNKGLRLERNIETEIPLLDLDPILIREALQNCLDNAIDYNTEQGWVRINLERQESAVVVHITNPGKGVTTDELSNIFNQFFRSQAAVQQHPDGNGLGLYLTKAIITQHGGEISCYSEPDKETTFSISIPIPHA